MAIGRLQWDQGRSTGGPRGNHQGRPIRPCHPRLGDAHLEGPFVGALLDQQFEALSAQNRGSDRLDVFAQVGETDSRARGASRPAHRRRPASLAVVTRCQQ